MEGIDILINAQGAHLDSGELKCRLHRKSRQTEKLLGNWSERRSKSDTERQCDPEGFGPGLMSDGYELI
jgi:hypothetical protein